MIITGNAPEAEARAYAQYLEKKHGKTLSRLDVQVNEDRADLDYTFSNMPFERIRRITGYLVGTMDHWNDAKSSEESDRVKHMNCSCSMEQL